MWPTAPPAPSWPGPTWCPSMPPRGGASTSCGRGSTTSWPPPPHLGRPQPAPAVDRPGLRRPGSGTVVTGTLAGGSLSVGDELVVVGPGGARARPVRVRGLETLGARREQVGPGHRVAANLAGLGHQDTRRGDALVEPGRWQAVTTLDASLRVLASLDHPVSRRERTWPTWARASIRCGCGSWDPRSSRRAARATCACTCRPPCRCCRATGSCCARAGGARRSAAARCSTWPRCAGPRGPGPTGPWTGSSRSGGGWRPRSWSASPAWIEPPTSAGGWWRRRPPRPRTVLAAVVAAGPLGLDVATLHERQRALLDTLEDIVVAGGRARPAQRADPLADHPFVTALESAPFPAPDGVDRGELRSGAAGVGGGARRRVVRLLGGGGGGRAGGRPAGRAPRRHHRGPGAKRWPPPASGPCRYWPTSTPWASPAAGATCASPVPDFPAPADRCHGPLAHGPAPDWNDVTRAAPELAAAVQPPEISWPGPPPGSCVRPR